MNLDIKFDFCHSKLDPLIAILKRPIVFFDTETTGVDCVKDRIVSLAACKISPDATEESFYQLINPQMPIPPDATAVHGITDEMVKDKPTFQVLAGAIEGFFRGCDLGGFNVSNFDVPLLHEEFCRCAFDGEALDLSQAIIIDAGTIFKRKEERTLTAAYKFFCGQVMSNAHNAEYDNKVTVDVTLAQLSRYGFSNLFEAAQWSEYDERRIDLAGKIVMNDKGEPVYSFGKVKGVRVVDDPGFARWMLGKDFTTNTKDCLRRILNGETMQQRSLI